MVYVSISVAVFFNIFLSISIAVLLLWILHFCLSIVAIDFSFLLQHCFYELFFSIVAKLLLYLFIFVAALLLWGEMGLLPK